MTLASVAVNHSHVTHKSFASTCHCTSIDTYIGLHTYVYVSMYLLKDAKGGMTQRWLGDSVHHTDHNRNDCIEVEL